MKNIEKLRNLLLESDCDAAILTGSPSRIYFSGFKGSDGYLFITEDEQYIITDSRYTIQVYNETKDFTLISGSDLNFECLSPIVKQKNIKSILFEDCDVSVSKYELIKSALPACEFVSAGNRLTEIRRKKSHEELKKVSSALELSEFALEQTIQRIREGMTEVQIAAVLESYMRSGGAERLAFDTICVSGKRSALPHGIPTNKTIEKGDFLTLDFGCIIDGYCSDITRTFVIGNPTDLQKEIYNIVLNAQLRAEDMIKPGIMAKEADAHAREVIDSSGYGVNFGHSLGHGVGIEIHELPNLSPRSAAILTKGDIITIEPGIYIENFGGVRIEDMMYIDNEKTKILTHFTKELIII